MPRVNVLLATALDKSLDYRAEHAAHAGAIVEVPLSGRKVMGVVLGDGTSDYPEEKMKAVIATPPVPSLQSAFLKFIDWVAEYTLAPRGAVLQLADLRSRINCRAKPTWRRNMSRPCRRFRRNNKLPMKK
jgi:primosomal protein N' (replication factor Y)